MRYVKFFVLFVMAVIAVVLAVANRGPVTLRLLPERVVESGLVPGDYAWETTLPLFLALLGAMFFGIVIGLILEALRESEHRREERRYRREAARLHRENLRLKAKAGEEDDDILGLSGA